MSADEPTQVVLLTPPGRGAVATLLVEGPLATSCVAARFQPAGGGPLDSRAEDQIVVGRWGGPDGEELVVCRRGRDRIEVHCHGGTAAADRVLRSLVDGGCQQMSWPEWLRLGNDDPIQVDARLALGKTLSLSTATVLLDQYHGALRRALSLAASALSERDSGRATTVLRSILKYAHLGLHLVEPWRVVLAGRPNVGKSSLLNALVGYRRAIVFDQPGTTRDVVTVVTAIGGWPVELSDTAGLRSGQTAIEEAGVERAERQLACADAVVLVSDATQIPTVEEQRLRKKWPMAVRVRNKCDLIDRPDSRDDELATSALTGDGIDQLAEAIVAQLVPEAPPRGAPVPFTLQQVETVRGALSAVENGNLTAALERLRMTNDEIPSDERMTKR